MSLCSTTCGRFPTIFHSQKRSFGSIRSGFGRIDPIASFLSGKHDSHRDQDVRARTDPAVELAQRTGCAVLAVMHQNKRQGVAAMYRAGGSIGFVGLARTAMMLGRDPDDPERRVLAQVKTTWPRECKAHRLRLSTSPDHDVAAIDWLGECDLSADDLCGPPESAEKSLGLDEAKEFLRDRAGRWTEAESGSRRRRQSKPDTPSEPYAEHAMPCGLPRVRFGRSQRSRYKAGWRDDVGQPSRPWPVGLAGWPLGRSATAAGALAMLWK